VAWGVGISHPRLPLDKTSCHTTPNTHAVAKSLDIGFISLPEQWPELNGMDQLWAYPFENSEGYWVPRSSVRAANFSVS
jgi:hypothetical protein